MRRLELTRLASADLASILSWSASEFGAAARSRYERLIETALVLLVNDPAPPGSRDRPELGRDVRTFHLRLVRTRASTGAGIVRTPRHLVTYEFDAERVLVLRVLHEAMDLARHLPPQ